MATFLRVTARTMLAVQNMTNAQYHILRASAADQCQVASFAGGGIDEVVGVLQNAPNSGQNATVGYEGVTKVVAGAAVTANRLITTNGSGRAVHANSGDWALGQALTAANADGDVIEALVRLPAIHVPSSQAAL